MSKVVAIAEDHVGLQLALAGVDVIPVSSVAAAEAILEAHLSGDADVLILQEELRDGLSEYYEAMLKRHKGAPLVVYCPSFSEEDSDVDAYLSSIIKPAVGYEIRLE
jgi:vacuolar-type H+-ATPase subunit F/Vma7